MKNLARTVCLLLSMAAFPFGAAADSAFCPQETDPAYCELAKATGGAALSCPTGPGAEACLREALAKANPAPAPERKPNPLPKIAKELTFRAMDSLSTLVFSFGFLCIALYRRLCLPGASGGLAVRTALAAAALPVFKCFEEPRIAALHAFFTPFLFLAALSAAAVLLGAIRWLGLRQAPENALRIAACAATWLAAAALFLGYLQQIYMMH